MENKKLPVGIENFAEIRREDFYYIDKTGLIRRFMQMQPKIAAIEEAAQKIKTLNYRQYENPQLEALAAEIMENTAGLKE